MLSAAATTPVDVAYIDPPYNQHSYLANYHIWETLVRWDKPAHYGVACKRTDVREAAGASITPAPISPEPLSSSSPQLLRADACCVVQRRGLSAPTSRPRPSSLLWAAASACSNARTTSGTWGSAQIGIYNPSGEKVGAVSHLRNKEFLFVVTPH